MGVVSNLGINTSYSTTVGDALRSSEISFPFVYCSFGHQPYLFSSCNLADKGHGVSGGHELEFPMPISSGSSIVDLEILASFDLMYIKGYII